MRRLSKVAIQHLVVLNMAVGILKVRKFEDVVSKAVNITKDKKRVNQKRKVIAQVEKKIDEITELTSVIFSRLSGEDLERIRRGHTKEAIELIPEKSTSPEVLGLYLMYLEFQDCIDEKMDSVMKEATEFDYMELIVLISEEIGLEKNVADDMYELALKLIDKVKK